MTTPQRLAAQIIIRAIQLRLALFLDAIRITIASR